jgi:hypothetical protein
MFSFTASGLSVISYPATVALPDVGESSPHSIRMVVDFPAPLGPKNPNTSPRRTENEILSTARKEPNIFVNPFTSTANPFSPGVFV